MRAARSGEGLSEGPNDQELRRLFERSAVAIYRAAIAGGGTLLVANHALVKLLGYDSVDEVLALDLDRDVYVDPAERAAMIERYRRETAPVAAEVRWRTRDGADELVRIYPHLVDDSSIDATALDLSELDTTAHELRQREEQLARTAMALELVLHQMSGMYWRVDRDLRIISTGGAVEAILGYAADAHLGKTLHDVHREDPGFPDPIRAHQRALVGEIVPYVSEYRGKFLANTIGPSRDANGNIVGVIGTAIDVTTQHLLERRMVDAQRVESLGVLAGGVAHDFNNLLVAILGNADLALHEIAPGSPGRTAIDNIRAAGLRAAELTNQLLAYAGRGGVATTRVVVAPLVDELLRLSAPSLTPSVRVTTEIAAELAVRGDAGQVRQVLLNLVGNARESIAAHGGTIAIAAHACVHDGRPTPDDVLAPPAGAYVRIAVTDDGAGITPEARRRMFEPFYTTKTTGHGLGLASVLGIVRAHGGGLRVVSTAGDGARFEIWWPADNGPTASGSADFPRVASSPSAGRTVLVVDDEDLVRDVVARMIEDLGYAAITAGDGSAALARLDAEHVDALLVDLTMPMMSGAELITAVRTRYPTLPIVLCSGYDRDRRGPVVADAYLPKPFRLDALEGVLATLWPSAS